MVFTSDFWSLEFSVSWFLLSVFSPLLVVSLPSLPLVLSSGFVLFILSCYVFTFLVLCRHIRIEAMFGSPLSLVVCSRAHVLSMVFAWCPTRFDWVIWGCLIRNKTCLLFVSTGIHSGKHFGRVRVAHLCSLLCCVLCSQCYQYLLIAHQFSLTFIWDTIAGTCIS
jgi:hypothetical protein